MTDLTFHPDLTTFRALAAEPGRRVISVWTRLLADDLTPVAAYRALCGTRPGTFLFESADAGQFSRYSCVGVRSAATLTIVDGRPTWQFPGREVVGLPSGDDPLDILRRTLAQLATRDVGELPPIASGLVGYLGYDAIRRIESLPEAPDDDLGVPELTMMLLADAAILDHHTGEVWLVANAINFDARDEGVETAYADATRRIEAMVRDLAAPQEPDLRRAAPTASAITRQRPQADFERIVDEAKAEIEAGEAFQIVASQRFEADCPADALDVYRVLRRSNPSPYLYLLRLDGFDVVGSSPEALVTVKNRRAVTRPIAGTRPRGATPDADAALEAELCADPKERAEHVMLVDLGRNDLGRVCKPGSVEVVEFAKVRRYSHVMHLEAAVVGELRDDVSALDATMSCFPAGTLSGAPKVRAMEIIDRLELTRRGLYGGVVGHFDLSGDSDVAIAIRTAVIKNGRAYVQAGAGVVADSVPASEDAETRNKAAAVLRAVEAASGLVRPTL